SSDLPRTTRRRTRHFRVTATPYPLADCGGIVRQRRCALLVAVLVRTASAVAHYEPYDAVPAQPLHQGRWGACNRAPRTRSRTTSPVASSRIRASTSAEQSMTYTVATDRPYICRCAPCIRRWFRSTQRVDSVTHVGRLRRRSVRHQPVTHVTLDRLALRTCPLADHFVGFLR